MAKHAKHAKHAQDAVIEDAPITVEPQAVSSHQKDHVPAHQKKSKRMRIVLTVVFVILALLLAALAYFAWNLVNEAHDVANQAATKKEQVTPQQDPSSVSDASSSAVERASAPSLVGLLGLTQKEALAQLGDDATVTSEKDITEKKTVKKKNGKKKVKTVVVGKNLTVALSGASSKDGTPTVYLTLSKGGKVTEAGFSASLDVLGYGNVSFSDAVTQEHVVENVLNDAGIPLEDGSVEMPKAEDYRTYAEDQKTIAQEQYTFTGKNKGTDGAKHAWSCRLNYDYSAANVSGNLADTIRQVYVYVECTGRS